MDITYSGGKYADRYHVNLDGTTVGSVVKEKDGYLFCKGIGHVSHRVKINTLKARTMRALVEELKRHVV